jgi:hypothetical protein
VTRFPPHPAKVVPVAIADHGRQVTRAYARLDDVESIQSKQSSDISANAAATATNTTAITTTNANVATQTTNLTALDTRLGGSSQETFLGSLNQAAVPGSASHTGVGTISGSGAVNNITNAEFNSVNSDVNDLADLLNALIGRLQASNLLT